VSCLRKTILEGVAGSHAYGLAGPDSDIDIRGIFVYDTIDLLGLEQPTLTVETKEPDYQGYELGKFVRLSLKANPNILEIMFLEEYFVCEPVAKELIDNRLKFMSKKIYKTYGGYAMNQLTHLKKLGDEPTKKRQKFARHMYRLMEQGIYALDSGVITLKIEDPEFVFRFGKWPFDKIENEFNNMEYQLADASHCSKLPEEPDYEWADLFLKKARMKYFEN
jgi:uncharacterized protein